jgi:hypothetical protein
MKTWHKILIGIFGAAVTVAPLFIKSASARKTLEEVEQVAGGAIGEVVAKEAK